MSRQPPTPAQADEPDDPPSLLQDAIDEARLIARLLYLIEQATEPPGGRTPRRRRPLREDLQLSDSAQDSMARTASETILTPPDDRQNRDTIGE